MRFDNVNQLVGNGLIYGLGGTLNGALSFLTLPLIARYLSPTEYGVIAMLLMMGLILSSLFSLGLGTSIGARYFSRELAAEREAVIIGALAILLVSAGVLVVLGLWFAEPLGLLLFEVADHTRLVRVAVVTTAVGIIVQPWRLKLQFEQRAKSFIVASFGSSFASFALIIFFVAILEKSVLGYLHALLLGQVVTFALFFLFAKNRMAYLPSWQDIRALLVEGVPLIPSFVFIFVIQNAARYPLQAYHGLDAVGVFTMGTSIGMAMGMLVEAFVRAWVPFSLSYMNKQEEARQLLARLTQYYLAAFGYIVLMFFFFAKPLVMMIFPQAYEDATRIIGLAAAAQFFLGLFSVLLPSVYFARKLYVVMLLQGVGALCSVVMYLSIIPRFGAIGAGFAVMLGNLLLAVLLLTWVRKDPGCRKIDYRQGKIYKTLAWLAALALLPTLLHSRVWLVNLAYAIFCSILAAWIMLRMGEIALSEVRQAMLSFLHRGQGESVP